MLLSQAIEEYLGSRRSEGVAANTVRNCDRDLRKLLLAAGNLHVHQLDGRHVDALFSQASGTCGPATLNNIQTNLGRFFGWCRSRRYMPKDTDPMEARTTRKVPRKLRNRLAVGEFPSLLDACYHPRDRMVVALGLYLFLRQSEIASLTLSDVHLDEAFVLVTVHKTGDVDEMPLCSELDIELRNYLAWYQQAPGVDGSLGREWYLTPAKSGYHGHRRGQTGLFVKDVGGALMRPLRRIGKVEQVAQRALAEVGFPIYLPGQMTPTGKPAKAGEGIHTLRRSGARALYDELSSQGRDGALMEVSTWLHHANVGMTQRYLGLQEERDKRDARIRGRSMYPSNVSADVVRLADRMSG